MASEIVTPQAATCKTFRAPLLDGTLALPQIWDLHLESSPKHPIFVYRSSDGVIKTILWGQAVRAFHAAARLVQAYVPPLDEGPEPPVVAVLAAVDHFTYFALLCGIMRAGYTAFPISVRNSDLGIAHLLKNTGTRHMFVTDDHVLQTLSKSALSLLAQEDGLNVHMMPVPSFEALYVDNSSIELLPPIKEIDMQSRGMILHSSGSTAFPKPINVTHHRFIQFARLPYYGEVDICGKIISLHSFPMFHATGCIQLPWVTGSGMVMSAFMPSNPPVIPTPDRVFEDIVATKSEIIFCPPMFVESWSRDENRIERLKDFIILFAGAPMPKGIGDMLSEKGVTLIPFYGATEAGCVTVFLPEEPRNEGWDWFILSPHIKPAFIPQDADDDTFELVIIACDSDTPAVINYEHNGALAYRTSDILVRHPTNHSLWKVYGRTDDQIMHTTGEKTNSGPIEGLLCRDPKIANAIMFGRGKFHAGVIVEPTAEHRFDPSDTDRVAVFRNEIWPSVEKANAYAPTHSRLFKEMILVINPAKPFELTPKGTPRRHVVIAAYEKEIEKAYADFEESSQTELAAPEKWDLKGSHAFVRTAFGRVLRDAVGDDDDIFQAGCDSLQATWIRNTILHALRRSTKINTRLVPFNFVYAHPTVTSLANYVTTLATQDQYHQPDSDRSIANMVGMVKKYSTHLPQHHPSESSSKSGGEVILLTGTTGGFGSYVLAELVEIPTVSRVYALNRTDARHGRPLAERQREVILDRGLDGTLVDNPKVVLLEGDTSLPDLGLGNSLCSEIRDNVTCIIHNAWRVDFNVSLSSMEPMLTGTRNLIELALASPQPTPPSFLFISSLSVYRHWRGFHQGPAPELPILDPGVAAGLGYGESKWVAEQVLANAASGTALKPTIVRLGQLSGGPNGSWNTAEWVPAIVRSAETVGCLPDAQGTVSFIPAHTAAQALVEMRNSGEPYFHLTHPRPVQWSTVFEHISSAMRVPLVPYDEWLTKLEAFAHSNPDAVARNPAVKILDFFSAAAQVQSVEGEETESMGFPTLSTDAAVKVSPTLRTAPQLGREEIERWLEYWGSVEFLHK